MERSRHYEDLRLSISSSALIKGTRTDRNVEREQRREVYEQGEVAFHE